MTQLLGFDPLKFLNITNLKGEERESASKSLLDKISQYLLIRISDLLSVEDVRKSKDPKALFSLGQDKIPDFNSKIKLFLDDFKKELSRLRYIPYS